jgi:hypothetical protein
MLIFSPFIRKQNGQEFYPPLFFAIYVYPRKTPSSLRAQAFVVKKKSAFHDCKPDFIRDLSLEISACNGNNIL